MKIIKYLICWIKARYELLSSADFCALCHAYEIEHSKIAEYALKTHFSRHVPEKDELDRIYRGSYELRWLYLHNIRRGRRLTDEEQHLMVTSMPIGGSNAFPSALREPALRELFEVGRVQKIGEYTRDFALPPDYELRLIERFRTEDKADYLNSYRRALNHYLLFAKGAKLTTPDVQLAILALNDEEMTVAMVENCNMTENILFVPTLRVLAEEGSLKALQKLLFNSFVESDELASIMLERFPQLKRIYDMSCLRRPLYKLEREAGQFWGTVAPNVDEYQLIIQSIETDAKHTKREEFVRDCLLPMMARPKTTAYFCAWCADNFPEISEQAYQRVRKIAKFYRDCYKK